MKTAMHSMVERAKRQDCKVRVNGNLTSRKKTNCKKIHQHVCTLQFEYK